MFIVTFTDGSQLKEADGITWDQVPLDKPIASVEIPIPYSDEVVGLEHCHGYYCHREAVSMITHVNGRPEGAPVHQLVAQVLGAIDYEQGVVHEVRVGVDGKVSTLEIPIKDFEASFIDPETRWGYFDPAIIRPGK